MKLLKTIGCYVKLGTMVHAITELLTLGNAYRVSFWIARQFGKDDCGCHKRELFFNCLTCKEECDE